MKNDWSNWQFFKKTEWEDVPEKPGVYKIRCLDNIGKPVKIKRLVRIDKGGVLSIGESGNLRQRLKQFWKSSREDTRHAAAWHYFAFRYDEKFPKESMQFCYTPSSSKNEAIRIEFILFLEYRKQFMDGPPLNINRGKYPRNYKKLFRKIIGKEPPEG